MVFFSEIPKRRLRKKINSGGTCLMCLFIFKKCAYSNVLPIATIDHFTNFLKSTTDSGISKLGAKHD